MMRCGTGISALLSLDISLIFSVWTSHCSEGRSVAAMLLLIPPLEGMHCRTQLQRPWVDTYEGHFSIGERQLGALGRSVG